MLVDRSHRAVLTLTGADRQTWLHSISTQHVSELPSGASTQNLSLDGQGRVEDHWWQTELGGTTYLDTEPWRGQPLLDYLRKMVFWSDVTPGSRTWPCCRCWVRGWRSNRCCMRWVWTGCPSS